MFKTSLSGLRQYNNIKITLLLPFLKAEETKACRMKTR